MTLSQAQQAKLDIIEQSPAAVAAKDKTSWVNLFADFAAIEDPVGSKPHISGVYDAKSGRIANAVIGRFFDTFIAPNTIEFDVANDIVADNYVLRDLNLHIIMAPKVKIQVPMHLLYELESQAEEGDYRILRLGAYWELMPMVQQLLGQGMAAAGVLWRLTLRMLSLQGLSGALGFARAGLNIGNAGKKQLEAFANYFQAGDELHLIQLFDPDNQGLQCFFQGEQKQLQVLDIVNELKGELSFDKLLVAGYCVSSSVNWTLDGKTYKGIAIFDFERRDKLITRARFYFN